MTNKNTQPRVAVIIPNWNGAADLAKCANSILEQSYNNFKLVFVDNASVDESRKIIESYIKRDDRVVAIWNDTNRGYTGGVNPGFEFAIKNNYTYAAPFNNDAIADKDWLKRLVEFLEKNPKYGIAACKLLHSDGKSIDSTADIYTNWGLPFPRGRDETDIDAYDDDCEVFGASGGASMYRVAMLKEVGLLDKDFFAYFEDIDISFRAQLFGWKVRYVPKSVVYHEEGGTRKRMVSSFATKQTLKNLPLVLFKNVPTRFYWRILWRFTFAHILFTGRSLQRGHIWTAIEANFLALFLTIKKIPERRRIQKSRKVSDEYIWDIITHDLPCNAHALRKLRAWWWKLIGKK